MTRSISLLLLGLLVTAAFAVENSELKRTPPSDECAGVGGLESATERAELQRLPSVLLAAKPDTRRSPGVEALLQAVPTAEKAATPTRIAAPSLDALESARMPLLPQSTAKPKLAPAPLPAESPEVTAEVAATPAPSPRPKAAIVPAPAVANTPATMAAVLPVASRPAAPVEAPARIAPVVTEPAVERDLLVAQAPPAPPAVLRPVATRSTTGCALSCEPYAPSCQQYAQCPLDDSGMDCCHGREGWFAHLCRKKHEAHGCAELFCEPPLGASMYSHANTQICKGLADQTVLYHYDFLTGEHANELSPRGIYQLEKIADLMLNTGLSHLTIETSVTNPKLDEARRASVIRELKAIEPSFADASVVVARPRSHGLRGEEAIIIDDNNLQNTQLRGGLLPKLEGFSTDGE